MTSKDFKLFIKKPLKSLNLENNDPKGNYYELQKNDWLNKSDKTDLLLDYWVKDN